MKRRGRLAPATKAREVPGGQLELECFRGKIRMGPPRHGRVIVYVETELGASLGLELAEEDLRGLHMLALSVWARTVIDA